MPINVHAKGVLVAPANTATEPTMANTATFAPMRLANVAPAIAPVASSGITSPPTKPVPIVSAVKNNFTSKWPDVAPFMASSISGKEKP